MRLSCLNYCHKSIPLLPNKLAYPEIFDKKNNSEIFYKNESSLIEQLKELLEGKTLLKTNNSQHLVYNYDWKKMVQIYDKTFRNLINQPFSHLTAKDLANSPE